MPASILSSMGQKLSEGASERTSLVEMFPGNMHRWDRVARLALGGVMFLVGWYAQPAAWAMAVRIFAFYPVVTAAVGWCPAYALLRFRTKR